MARLRVGGLLAAVVLLVAGDVCCLRPRSAGSESPNSANASNPVNNLQIASNTANVEWDHELSSLPPAALLDGEVVPSPAEEATPVPVEMAEAAQPSSPAAVSQPVQASQRTAPTRRRDHLEFRGA